MDNIISTSPFIHLPKVPTKLASTQCVFFNQELLICGGVYERKCYSYHTKQKQYKLICEYPKEVDLLGHAVLQCPILSENTNQSLTLLSFGGQYEGKKKHTLLMHYHSVWDQDSSSSSSVDSSTPINTWLPLKDGVTIGTEQDNMWYFRALVGGTNKDLLFIIYKPNHLDVLQLPSFKYLTQTTLPFKSINYGF